MDIKRAEKIAGTLEKRVFSGEYKDGERLDEVKLASEFGVSRTPIREALQVLVASGLAEQIPRRGVFVRQPGPVELLEMFETMAELEVACGRLAATRITADLLEELNAAHGRCQDAIGRSDIELYYAENETFHRIIYRASANGYLEVQALKLQNKLRVFRKLQLHFRGRLQQSMAEHSQILSALQLGDAQAVSDALRCHVAVQGEKFHQLIASLRK